MTEQHMLVEGQDADEVRAKYDRLTAHMRAKGYVPQGAVFSGQRGGRMYMRQVYQQQDVTPELKRNIKILPVMM